MKYIEVQIFIIQYELLFFIYVSHCIYLFMYFIYEESFMSLKVHYLMFCKVSKRKPINYHFDQFFGSSSVHQHVTLEILQFK